MQRLIPAGGFRSLLALIAVFAMVLTASATALAQTTPEATPTPGGIATPTLDLPDDQAAIAVVHAAASAPAVDVLVDDEVALSNVEFGTVSEFLMIDSGDHNVKVVPTGGDVSQAVVDTDVSLDSGKVYAVVAASGSDGPEVKAFEINNEPVADGSSRIIAIHAASTVDAIDIAAVGGEPIIEDVSYFNASDAADFTGTTAEFEIRATGEQGSLVTLPPFELSAGSSVALIVTTDAMGQPYPLVVGTFPGNESDEEVVTTPVA